VVHVAGAGFLSKGLLKACRRPFKHLLKAF
jgi:hypothetical protein